MHQFPKLGPRVIDTSVIRRLINLSSAVFSYRFHSPFVGSIVRMRMFNTMEPRASSIMLICFDCLATGSYSDRLKECCCCHTNV